MSAWFAQQPVIQLEPAKSEDGEPLTEEGDIRASAAMGAETTALGGVLPMVAPVTELVRGAVEQVSDGPDLIILPQGGSAAEFSPSSATAVDAGPSLPNHPAPVADPGVIASDPETFVTARVEDPLLGRSTTRGSTAVDLERSRSGVTTTTAMAADGAATAVTQASVLPGPLPMLRPSIRAIAGKSDPELSSAGVTNDRNLPVRLEIMHRPLQVGGTPLAGEELLHKVPTSVATDDLAALVGQTGTDDEHGTAELAKSPWGDRVVVMGEIPQGHPLSHPTLTVDQAPSSSFPKQLEALVSEGARISLSGGGEKTQMRMTLEPRELGRLEMHISMENGLITARFDAESHMVKQLIEAELPRLRDTLEQQGLHLDQVSVQVGGGQTQGFGDRQMRDRKPIGTTKPRGRYEAVAGVTMASGGPNATPRITLGHSVDYTV